MLTVRDDQLAALETGRDERLVHRIADFLRETSPAPAAAAGADGLHALVVAALARSRSWDVRIEWDACRFALFCLELGLDMDRRPWAHAILSDAELSVTERIDALEHVWANYLR